MVFRNKEMQGFVVGWTVEFVTLALEFMARLEPTVGFVLRQKATKTFFTQRHESVNVRALPGFLKRPVVHHDRLGVSAVDTKTTQNLMSWKGLR